MIETLKTAFDILVIGFSATVVILVLLAGVVGVLNSYNGRE